MNKKMAILLAVLLLPLPELGAGESSDAHRAIQLRSRKVFDSLVKIRRDIHRHPETGGHEKRTSGLVAKYLGDLGLEVIRGIGGYGVIGVLKTGRPGPVVGWRADMDALSTTLSETGEFASKVPGVRHICGHDVHTVAALGIADVLASIKDRLKGSVVFIFQPSEENFQGARAMIEDGLFEKVKPDVVFALHVAPFDSGKVAVKPDEMFALRGLLLEVVLKPRVLSTPDRQELVDFMKALSTHSRETLTSFTQLIDSEKGIMSPDTPLRDYFFLSQESLKIEETGSRPVITANIYASGRKRIGEKIEQLKKSKWAASIEKITCSGPEWTRSVTNHPTLTQQAVETISSVYGPENVLKIYGVTPLFNDDFALFQDKVPGVYFFLGGSNEEKEIMAMPHSPGFTVDEQCIRTATNYFSSLIYTQLLKGSVR